jgi:hypothetical protein
MYRSKINNIGDQFVAVIKRHRRKMFFQIYEWLMLEAGVLDNLSKNNITKVEISMPEEN